MDVSIEEELDWVIRHLLSELGLTLEELRDQARAVTRGRGKNYPAAAGGSAALR
jgi:hypothetical protein